MAVVSSCLIQLTRHKCNQEVISTHHYPVLFGNQTLAMENSSVQGFQSHVDDEDNSQPFPALLEEAMLTWRCLRKALVDNDRHEIEAAVRSSPNSNWT